jgi:hypothetical protein
MFFDGVEEFAKLVVDDLHQLVLHGLVQVYGLGNTYCIYGRS